MSPKVLLPRDTPAVQSLISSYTGSEVSLALEKEVEAFFRTDSGKTVLHRERVGVPMILLLLSLLLLLLCKDMIRDKVELSLAESLGDFMGGDTTSLPGVGRVGGCVRWIMCGGRG